MGIDEPGAGEGPDVEPVGVPDGLADALPAGRMVATAVAFAVGLGVGFGVGLGVGFGVGFAVGLGVGFAVGFGVGVAVGFGVAAALTVTASGLTVVSWQGVPPAPIAPKRYGQDPTGNLRVPVYVTPTLKSVPRGVMLLQMPLTCTRTQSGFFPDLSVTRTLNVKLMSVVPTDGEAVPPSIVMEPQDPAWAGATRPASDHHEQVARARARMRFSRRRRSL